MATYVVFLRAINLGARRKFAKDDIVAATQAAGFTGVATHINTGNVRVETRLRSRERVEATLEEAYAADRGFDVPCVAFDADELGRVVADGHALLEELRAERPAGWEGKDYVSLLKQEPSAQAAAAFEARGGDEEAVRVRGRAAHLLMEAYGRASITNATVERGLGVATNRGLAVLTTVLGKWC